MTEFELALAAVPGVLALVGGAMGYARLQQRMTSVEKDLSKVQDLSDKVTRIDERTLSTDRAITDVKQSVDRLVQNMIDEPSRWHERNRERRPNP